MFSKVVGSNLQIYSIINSFTGTSLGKYEGWLNYSFVYYQGLFNSVINFRQSLVNLTADLLHKVFAKELSRL